MILKLESISTESLKNFIKKMKLLSDSFFMTFSNGIFSSKMKASKAKDKVKMISISLEDLEIKESEDSKLNEKAKKFEGCIRFSFNRWSYLLKVLDFFTKTVDIEFHIIEEDSYWVTTKALFKNDSLKMTVNAHPMLEWNQLDDNVRKIVLNDLGLMHSFLLKEDQIKKLKDLCGLSDQVYYLVSVKDNKCYFSKDNFEILVDDKASTNSEDFEGKFFVNTLDYLDSCDYYVKICKSKAIFSAVEEDSIIVVSIAIIHEE